MVKTNVDYSFAVLSLVIAAAVIVLYALDFIGIRAAVPLLGLGLASLAISIIPFEGPPGRTG